MNNVSFYKQSSNSFHQANLQLQMPPANVWWVLKTNLYSEARRIAVSSNSQWQHKEIRFFFCVDTALLIMYTTECYAATVCGSWEVAHHHPTNILEGGGFAHKAAKCCNTILVLTIWKCYDFNILNNLFTHTNCKISFNNW